MTNDKTIERIRKLLRLARDRGASEHEAAVAMEMASRMMLEAGVDESDVLRKTQEVVTSDPVSAEEIWQQLVGSVCGALHACRAVYMKPRHDAETKMAFVGRELNVAAAVETCDYLLEQVERLYQQKMRELRGYYIRQDFETSFKDGVAMRLVHRTAEIIKANRLEIPPEKALVLIDESLASADEALRRANVPAADPPQIRRGSGSSVGYAEGVRVLFGEAIKKS